MGMGMEMGREMEMGMGTGKAMRIGARMGVDGNGNGGNEDGNRYGDGDKDRDGKGYRDHDKDGDRDGDKVRAMLTPSLSSPHSDPWQHSKRFQRCGAAGIHHRGERHPHPPPEVPPVPGGGAVSRQHPHPAALRRQAGPRHLPLHGVAALRRGLAELCAAVPGLPAHLPGGTAHTPEPLRVPHGLSGSGAGKDSSVLQVLGGAAGSKSIPGVGWCLERGAVIWSSPCSWVPAASTDGLGGSRENPAGSERVFPGTYPGAGCCGVGQGVRGSHGTRKLQAQGMLWVQHDGGGCCYPPGGHGDGWPWQRVPQWGVKGPGGNLQCQGWKWEQDGSEPCPDPACSGGHGQGPWGG